jgi:hypothetical protein
MGKKYYKFTYRKGRTTTNRLTDAQVRKYRKYYKGTPVKITAIKSRQKRRRRPSSPFSGIFG